MKIEILKIKENPLLNRKEFDFRVVYEGPIPNIKEVRAEVIKTLNSNEKLTIIDSVKPSFGIKTLKGFGKIYNTEKDMAIEPKHRLKKNLGIGEKTEKESAPQTKTA